jgi:hypothetical protein
MKMDKNTKILLGVGAVALIGYFIYKNNTTTKANATGKKGGMMIQNADMGMGMLGAKVDCSSTDTPDAKANKCKCPCVQTIASAGGTDLCANGHICRGGIASLSANL